MNKRHALLISLAIGAAAIAGTVAATKTAHLGRSATTTQSSPAALITQRTKALDRTEAALRKALAERPPKLPPVPKAATGSPIAAAPAAAAAPPQRVVYVRPAPVIRHVPRAGGHESEHESEGGSQHENGGGGFDD